MHMRMHACAKMDTRAHTHTYSHARTHTHLHTPHIPHIHTLLVLIRSNTRACTPQAQEAASLLIQLGEPAGPIRQQFVTLFSARSPKPFILNPQVSPRARLLRAHRHRVPAPALHVTLDAENVARLRIPAALTQKASSSHERQGSVTMSDPEGPLSSEFVHTAKNMILGYQMLLPGGGGGADGAGRGLQGDGVVAGGAAAAASGADNGATGGQGALAAGAGEGVEEDGGGAEAEEAKQLVKVVDDIFKNYLEALRQVVREADSCEDVAPLVALLERWHDAMRGIEALMPQVCSRGGAREHVRLCAYRRSRVSLRVLCVCVCMHACMHACMYARASLVVLGRAVSRVIAVCAQCGVCWTGASAGRGSGRDRRAGAFGAH